MSLAQEAKTLGDLNDYSESVGGLLRLRRREEKWVPLVDAQKLESENAIMNEHNICLEQENVELNKKLIEANKILDEEKEFLTPSLKRLRMYLTMKETEGTK
jgi:hypothetical protein